MKTRNAFKRFSAFLLALAMILCEMPAISARAAEGDKPFTGAGAFEMVEDDNFEADVAFSDNWKDDVSSGGTIYFANFGYDFPEEARPTLAEFAASYSKIHAAFKVIDLETTGTVSVGSTILNLIRELPEEEQTDGPYDYTWPGMATEGPAVLEEGNQEYTADFSDMEFDNDANWMVAGISVEFTTTDVNTTFGLRSVNWTKPVYVDFTGEDCYELIQDEWYSNLIEFSDDWADENGYYANFGNWSVAEKNMNLADFAAQYGHILIETKIPKLAEDSDVHLINVAVEYKADLSDEEGEVKRVEKQLSDCAFGEGSNSFDIDFTDVAYDEKYAEWYVCSIVVDIVSSTDKSLKLLYKDAEIPETNKLYFSKDWNYDEHALPEWSGATSNLYITYGNGENIALMYYAEDEEGNLIAKPVSLAGDSALVLNNDLKIYYQIDEDADKELCDTVINPQNGDARLGDPLINSEEDDGYYLGWTTFGKIGIYTIESTNEDYIGSVKVYVNPSDWSFYNENNELMTSESTFTRKSGETITLIPANQDKEYSIIVLAYMGYGSDGVAGREFVTAKDAEENDVTDKLFVTNAQTIEQDELAGWADLENVKRLGELPILKGDTSLTLTDFAHEYVTFVVRYEGEEGYEYSSYDWNESEESKNEFAERPDEIAVEDQISGFGGYIVNEAEYRTGDIDWSSGEPLARAYGSSMKEVIDKLSAAMREGKATNYGYIWIESGFVVNDPVSYENSRKEQYISSDIGGAADIEGVIIIATANEYDYNLAFSGDFIREMAAEMGDAEGVDGHEFSFGWLRDDAENAEDSVHTVAVQWAQNVENPDDIVYLIPATADNDYAFYFLNGNPDEGFTISDPVWEIQTVHEEGPVSFATISNHGGGKYYVVKGWLGIQNEFPKLHVDATNEVFLLGNFAEVPEGEANIFMKLAEGSKTIINGDIYTLTEDGKVNVDPRSGDPSFTLENGEITSNAGSYEHWQLGEVNYNYTVLVDKLETKVSAGFSDNSNIGDANADMDIDSIYDQISGDLTDEEKKKVDGGNNITVETGITDVTGNDIPEDMADEIKDINPGSVEYIDISLKYFVGYGMDEGSKITETADDVYLTITLMGDDYDTDPEKYIIGRYHEGEYEELVPESVKLIEGGVEVTFKSNKFSVYAIVYGANRKATAITGTATNTVYNYEEEPSPEGLTVTVTYEEGEPDVYAYNEIEEIGLTWVLLDKAGKAASKDKNGNYPVGTYTWSIVDEKGKTVATDATVITIRMGYTITYMLAGGTKKNESAFITKYYSDAESVVLPTEADFEDNTDYTFAGWYTSASYKDSELVTVIEPVKYKDYVLYAKWVAGTLTVNFNASGGNNGGSTAKVVLYNQKKGTLTANGFKDSTRAFMGWALTSDATDVVFANKESVIVTTASDVSGGDKIVITKINGVDVTDYVANGAITLYAVWENSFAIKYISDDLTYLEDSYTYGKKKTLDTTIKTTKPGYTFGGWYNAAGKKLTEISKTSTGDVVLTAKWTANTYKIKYNKNVSTGVTGKVADGKFTYDAAKVLATNAYKRPGYKFLGWNTDKTAETALYADGEAVTNLATSGTVILYAIWTPTTYTMSFDPLCAAEDISGGEIADITYSYSKTSGETLSKPEREGYTFVGWYKEINYKTQVKSTKGLSADLTVYAKWNTKYDIHFDANGGTGSMNNIANVEYAKAKELTANKFKYKDVSGNEIAAFMGWDTDSAGTTVVYTNKQKISYPSAMEKADGKFVLNLYAVWENEWAVNYETNGGVLPADTALTYVYKTGITKLPTPTKDGYTFSGWYKDKNFKTKVTSISKTSTKDVTLYAKWTAKSYTVTFNVNAPEGSKATGKTNKQSLKYGTSKALTKNGFKVTGYTFLGWATSADATEPEFTNAQKVSDFGAYESKITLYAVWELTEYKVTYKMAGVMDDVVETYTIKTGYTLMEAPTKLGYTLQGFFTDNKFKKKAENLKVGTTGDKVIYVKWTQNK